MQTNAAVFLALLGLVSTGYAQMPAPAPGPACTNTVAQTAADAGLTTLVEAVQAAGLASTLSNPNLAYTVFAPTNEAFVEAMSELNVTSAELLASPLLTPILENHLLGFPLTAADLISYKTVETMADGGLAQLNITATSTGNGTIVEVSSPVVTANVVMANIRACRSIIHVIDSVLIPDQL